MKKQDDGRRLCSALCIKFPKGADISSRSIVAHYYEWRQGRTRAFGSI